MRGLPKELLSVAVAASKLGVSRQGLIAMIRDGRLADMGIRSRRVGHMWRIHAGDLSAFIDGTDATTEGASA